VEPLKQSAVWWCIGRHDFRANQPANACAEMGYARIETGPEADRDVIRENGLTIAMTGGHGALTGGLIRRADHDPIEALRAADCMFSVT